MKAAVYHGPKDIRIEEVELRKPKEDEVCIKIKYCGVCGTDIHIYEGDSGAFAVKPPLIPGHEFAGVVEAVGDAVEHLKVGDKVSGDPNIMCGRCYFCRNGMEHFCENVTGVGTTADGGFAQYTVMKASHAYKLPENIDLMTAAMAEPMSCCIHGIDLCEIKQGSTVLVIGAGPIGVIMLQLAKLSGAAKLIVSEPVKEKRELALKLGADLVIDPINEDIEKILSEYTKNVDCVIECAGSKRTQEQAVKLAGKSARVMFFGLTSPETEISIKPDDIFKKELTIRSSFINPYTFSRAIDTLASGSVDVKSIITNVVKLEDIKEVFKDPEYRRSGKVMISME